MTRRRRTTKACVHCGELTWADIQRKVTVRIDDRKLLQFRLCPECVHSLAVAVTRFATDPHPPR